MSSTSPLIPSTPECRPPVHLVEYVVEFFDNPASPVVYGGTYAALSPTKTIPGNVGDDLAYGLYRIDALDRQYFVHMKAYYPAHSDPYQGDIGPSFERFLLLSDTFGTGFGSLNIAAPTATAAPFNWTLSNTWLFLDPTVTPQWNTWNQ